MDGDGGEVALHYGGDCQIQRVFDGERCAVGGVNRVCCLVAIIFDCADISDVTDTEF